MFFVFLLFCIARASQPCDPGFDCWLRSKIITINDYTSTQNQTTLTVDQITCSNTSIGDLNSTLTSPYSLHITTSNTALNCAGYWTYTTSSNETNNGTITVVATGISMTVDINTVSNATNYGLIDDYEVTCSIQAPPVITYSFSTNNIPSSFQTDVQQYFNEQVGVSGCSYIVSSSSDGLGDTFNGIVTWVTNAIGNSMMMPDCIFTFSYCLTVTLLTNGFNL